MRKIRVVTLLAAIALVVAACGGDDPDTGAQSDDGSGDTTEVESDGVHVASSELGQILVTPEGLSLYVFTADSEGASACNDACAEAWPPLSADTEISPDLDASMFSSITRDDGSSQLAVNGMALYTYSADTGPGDTAGQGVNGAWFVGDPTGSMIETEAAGSGAPVSDFDY